MLSRWGGQKHCVVIIGSSSWFVFCSNLLGKCKTDFAALCKKGKSGQADVAFKHSFALVWSTIQHQLANTPVEESQG